MLNSIKIKFYIVLMSCLFAGYTWALVTGTSIFGDDHVAKGMSSTGGGHFGGTGGIYFHK